MVKDLVWYKKNVGYNVGVRKYPGDAIGVLLNSDNPFVSVDRDNLSDFKRANKRAIVEALIIEAPEPTTEWDNPNIITDEEVTALVKQRLALKSRLPSFTSVPILYKLLDEAKTQDRAKSIISMIQARIDELEEETDFVTPVLNRNNDDLNKK